MDGRARLLEDQLRHTPQVRPWRIAQVGQGLARLSGQAMQGLAVRIGATVGRQHFLPQADHLVAIGVQLEGLRIMVVGDEQIATAFDQAHQRIVHVQGNEPALERPELRAQARHPGREEGERQRVRHGELDHVLARRAVCAQHGAGVLQRLQDFQRLVVQRLAGPRQPGGVGAAVHQVGPRPGLQRLDAARESRLRDMPQLRRSAETARLGQAHKILKPFGFHGWIICLRYATAIGASAHAPGCGASRCKSPHNGHAASAALTTRTQRFLHHRNMVGHGSAAFPRSP